MTAITQPLHSWARSNPIQDVKKLETQALVWNISKITAVAVAAICFFALTLTITLGTTTNIAPFVLIGLICSTQAASQSQAYGKEFEKQAEISRLIASQYKAIQNWTEDHIREFLIHQEVAIPVGVPLRSLLPLIARFQAREKEATEAKQAAQDLLQAIFPNQGVKESELRLVRLSSRLMGWQKLEREAIPAALEAALILQILSEPHKQLHISQLGSPRIKTFEERQFDRLYGPNDNYFIFRKKLRRTPLTLAELMAVNLSPQALRQKLFPRL